MKIQVKAEGPRNANILFVGEAPSFEEVNAGRPFIGTAGRELDRLLQRTGINRKSAYITNIVKYKLPNNDFSKMYTNAQQTHPTPELQEWWKELEKEIKEVNPNVIVPLGRHALLAICGLDRIGNWRGSIIESKWGAKCVPTYHPMGVIYNYSDRPLVLADLKKAKRESSFDFINKKERTYVIEPFVKDVREAYERIKKEGIVAVDIETQYLSRISCIGFAPTSDWAICIPFNSDRGAYWSSFELSEVRYYIKSILEDPAIKKVGQNFHYDWCYLKGKEDWDVRNYHFDTLTAHHCAWPELDKDLATMASIYTSEPYWKDEGKDRKGVADWHRYWTYNCKDAAITRELYEPLQAEIEDNGVGEIFEFEMSMYPILVNATLRGIKYDRAKGNQWRKEVRELRGEYERKLDSLLPEDWTCTACKGKGVKRKRSKTKQPYVKEFKTKPNETHYKYVMHEVVCDDCNGNVRHINPASPVQLASLIYDKIKLPKVAKKKSRSTDEDALIKLEARYPNEIFKTILDIRSCDKALVYLDSGIRPDNRISCTLAIATETGRMKSNADPFGFGTNLQNIPRKGSKDKPINKYNFRDLFIADEGKIFYGPDYAKAEAMVVAYESNDAEYIRLFEDGADIHTENSATIFNKDSKAITYDERQLGKKVCHGLNYRMGWQTLCDSVVKELGPEYAIGKKDAEEFKRNYFARFHGIARWHDETSEKLRESRTLVNCFGRKRIFLGRLNDQTLRIAIAFIPQSTVADLCNFSIPVVLEKVPDVEFLLQVHDQLLLQGADDKRKEKRAWEIEGAMKRTLLTTDGLRKYSIPVDMAIGYKWGGLEKLDMKQG